MSSNPTPEWQAFHKSLANAVLSDSISTAQYLELRYGSNTLSEAELRLAVCKRKYGEYRLLRDMWQEERASKRRWWTVTAVMAVGFVVYLLIDYWAFKH